MKGFRTALRKHRRLAVLLLALALCAKVLIPAGYMVAQQGQVLTVAVCADASGAKLTRQIVVPMHGEPGDPGATQGKSGGVCPYAGLSMAGLADSDALLLALALAFLIALGFAPAQVPAFRSVAHLRPPLRGPPALA